MGEHAVKLPDIGEGVVEAEIVEWRVKPGDAVREDDPLVDIMTDKATVELPSPVDGVVSSVTGEPGDIAAVGSVIVVIAMDGASPVVEADPKKAPSRELAPVPARDLAAAPSRQATPVNTAPAARSGRALASPAVRQRARDADVNLDDVPGSGPAGRITHQDLDDYIASGGRLQAFAGAGVPVRAPRTGTNVVKVIGLRRKIAENMARSKRSIPHFAYVEEVDVTALEELRKHLNAERADGQPKLTILPFLMQALVRALPDFPNANATFDDEAGVVTQYDGVHCGIAAATPHGLMVPVVRHAETLDVWECADELARLADAARSGKATKDDLTGSSITITSLGALGGIASTPVINYPEVAIIGVNKIVDRPVVVDGNIEIRKQMNLSSSFDHRIVDGFDAARLIQAVKGLLEHPATIFM